MPQSPKRRAGRSFLHKPLIPLDLSTCGVPAIDLATDLLFSEVSPEVRMLEAIRKAAVLPGVSPQTLIAAVTLTAFCWLLANDLIRPLAVLLLQLYLAF
jgi:hypothetical protein